MHAAAAEVMRDFSGLELVRLFVAGISGCVFLSCAVGNWGLIVQGVFGALRGVNGHFSLLLPFIGPVIGMMAILISPWPRLHHWFWTAAILCPDWLLMLWCLTTGWIVKDQDRPSR